MTRVPVLAAIRQKVRALDPELPLIEHPADGGVGVDQRRPAAAQRRRCSACSRAWRCSSPRSATYGVLAYSVSQRTQRARACAWRSAPTAAASCASCVREGMTVGIGGIVVGVAAAIAMSQALSALVFGVSVWDPFTYVAVSSTLAGVALASCAIPALRAARVDPMAALRLE